MPGDAPETVTCEICGTTFDPGDSRGWCPNTDCGEWQHPSYQESVTAGDGGEDIDAPTKECPGCKKEVRADANFCKFCAYEFEDTGTDTDTDTEGTDSTETEPALEECPHCSATLARIPTERLERDGCPMCGEDLQPVLAASEEPPVTPADLHSCPACEADLTDISPEMRIACPNCHDNLEAVIAEDVDAAHAHARVDVLSGIAEAYSDRLAAAGIETVADLVGADPASLAEATGVSESRLADWIEQAPVDPADVGAAVDSGADADATGDSEPTADAAVTGAGTDADAGAPPDAGGDVGGAGGEPTGPETAADPQTPNRGGVTDDGHPSTSTSDDPDESAPSTAGESAPSTTGESAPSTTGESAPSTTGESTPSTTGESAPSTTGESAPSTTGESGDSQPGTAGEVGRDESAATDTAASGSEPVDTGGTGFDDTAAPATGEPGGLSGDAGQSPSGEPAESSMDDTGSVADDTVIQPPTPTVFLEVMGRDIHVEDGGTIGREVREAMVEGGASEEDARYVHREHARLEVVNGQCYLVRLGENSLKVNDDRVGDHERVRLANGDEVSFSEVVTATVRIE